MATFTVEAASVKKELPDYKNGPKKVIALSLKGDGDSPMTVAEWFTAASTAIPQPGDKLDGEVKPGDYGNNFYPAGNKGGRGGGGKSIHEQRRIAMQHAQKAGVDIARLVIEGADVRPGSEQIVQVVKRIARELFDQIEEVAK